MKRRNKGLMLLVTLLLITLFSTTVFAADEAEYVPKLFGTFWALIPPLVAIVLALITKEVYSSLFIGIVIGGVLYAGGSFEKTLTHVLSDGIVGSLSDSYNVGILVFLVVLGTIVASCAPTLVLMCLEAHSPNAADPPALFINATIVPRTTKNTKIPTL